MANIWKWNCLFLYAATVFNRLDSMERNETYINRIYMIRKPKHLAKHECTNVIFMSICCKIYRQCGKRARIKWLLQRNCIMFYGKIHMLICRYQWIFRFGWSEFNLHANEIICKWKFWNSFAKTALRLYWAEERQSDIGEMEMEWYHETHAICFYENRKWKRLKIISVTDAPQT